MARDTLQLYIGNTEELPGNSGLEMSQCIELRVQTIFLSIYMSECSDLAAVIGYDLSSSPHMPSFTQ